MNLAKEYCQRNNIKFPLVDFSKYGFLILKNNLPAAKQGECVLWSFMRVEKATRSFMPPCYLFEKYSPKAFSKSRREKFISFNLSNHGCMQYKSHFCSLYFCVEKRNYIELENYEQYMFDLAKKINPDVVVSDPSLVKISAMQFFIISNQNAFYESSFLRDRIKSISLVFQEEVSNKSKLPMYSTFSNGDILGSSMRKRWIEFKREFVERYNYPFADSLKSF